MYRVFSCVVGRGCLLWPVHSLGRTLLAFALLHSVLQGQICLLLQVFLDFLLLHSRCFLASYFCIPVPYNEKSIFLGYSCLENPMNSMKRQNYRMLKEEVRRSVGAQYATRDQWRNNSRKNERMEPKQKQYPVVHVTGDRARSNAVKSNIA